MVCRSRFHDLGKHLSFLSGVWLVREMEDVSDTYTSAQQLKTNQSIKSVGHLSKVYLLVKTSTLAGIRDFVVFLLNTSTRYPPPPPRITAEQLYVCKQFVAFVLQKTLDIQWFVYNLFTVRTNTHNMNTL